MRTLVWMGMSILIVAANVRAADNGSSGRHSTVPLSRFCDPVCELQSQDAAFGILVEVYREHQAYRIEYDYQIRQVEAQDLKGDGNSLVIESDTKGLLALRKFVLALAHREREVRLATMETQVANFRSAYGCVRKIDEDYVGEKVPRIFDQQNARDKIKDLVVISPGTIASGTIGAQPSVPASMVLWDEPQGPANECDLVEPCD